MIKILVLLAQICKWVYDTKNDFSVVGFENMVANERVALLKNKKGMCIVAHRGTYSLDDIEKDIFAQIDPICKKSNYVDSFYESFKEETNGLDLENCSEIIFTGHSLGGVMAIIHGEKFHKEHSEKKISIVTFGAPKACCIEKKELGFSILRVENARDPIPSLPFTPKDSVVHCSSHSLHANSQKVIFKSPTLPIPSIDMKINYHHIDKYLEIALK